MRPFLENLWKDFFLQIIESGEVAKKASHSDEKILGQSLDFRWMAIEELAIGLKVFAFIEDHAPFDAAVEHSGLVKIEINPGEAPDHTENMFEAVFEFWWRLAFRRVFFGASDKRMARNAPQLAGDGRRS